MGTSSFLVDRDQNINFISWGWHQVITACWNYTLSTITHFLQSHTFYNHILSTITHFLQSHTFYNHTLSTITHFLQSHTFYNHTLSTITHFLQSHTFYKHTLYTSTHFLQSHTFYNHCWRNTWDFSGHMCGIYWTRHNACNMTLQYNNFSPRYLCV